MAGLILNIEEEQVDRRATRKRVESVLEAVRMYRIMGILRNENAANSSMHKLFKVAEQGVAYDLDSEGNVLSVCNEVEQAITLLDDQEHEIIRKRYLNRDKTLDFLLYHELHMSERTYYRMKARAIEKLAYMLRLEVKVK